MVEELEKEKKRKGLRFVSRKSSRKTLGKWKKLDDMDNSDKINETHREEVVALPGQVFGVPVEIAIDVNPSLDGIPLPAFFRYSIDYVEAHGIMQEGIYRVSSPKSRLDELEKKANEGVQLDFCDGHEAAGLIKRFLRQLPSPLLSCDFEVLVRSCFCDWRGVCQCVVLTEMKEMLRGIGRPQFYLLGYIVLHAQNVIKMVILGEFDTFIVHGFFAIRED
uniref:Rho-GAP domain-containing protein n=1 Tax=Angiostrongylus cantonensis TaxID=6313 RepID=A0A0K0CY44_ANGCA